MPEAVDFHSNLVVGGWARWAVGVAGVLVEQRLVESVNDRAVKTASDWLQEVVDEIGDWSELLERQVGYVGDSSLDELSHKASATGTLGVQDIAEVHCTASEVGERDSGIGVDAIGVATELEGAWVGEELGCKVRENVDGVVLVGRSPSVPVLRDPFLAWQPLEVVGAVTLNGEELLEHVLVEVAILVLGGVVAHD